MGSKKGLLYSSNLWNLRKVYCTDFEESINESVNLKGVVCCQLQPVNQPYENLNLTLVQPILDCAMIIWYTDTMFEFKSV